MKSNLPATPNPVFPHTIDNGRGEKLTFLRLQPEPDGDRLLVENWVTPMQGPPMHTHWLQDECLTVKQGRLAYEVPGQPTQYAEVGETILFKRGVPHRFWNAGDDLLHCQGWIKPAHTIVFYLSAIFDAQVKTGSARPDPFDAAFLMTRYAGEYDLPTLPSFVKHVVIPTTYRVGKLLGKYKHFANAPAPVLA